MTQKYTGQQFEVEFARAWYEYVKAGKVGVDPHCNWEFRSDERLPFNSATPSVPPFSVCHQFRWKPAPKRMVTIGYYHHLKDGDVCSWNRKTLIAPEVEAPAVGTPVYLLDKKPEVEWEDRPWLVSWLNAGLVFLTREDAAAMSEWLAVCRKGEQ